MDNYDGGCGSRGNQSQKNVLGWSSHEVSFDEHFVNTVDDGLKPIPPKLSQEMLNTPGNNSQEELSLTISGINVHSSDLDISDGGLDIFTKGLDDENFMAEAEVTSSQNQSSELYIPEADDTNNFQYRHQSEHFIFSGDNEVKLFQQKLNGHGKFLPGRGKMIFENVSDAESSQQREIQPSNFFYREVESERENSEVSSSQESNRDLPSVVAWNGEYDFQVIPASRSNKKCCYSDTRNKIYCLPNIPILFNMKVDITKVKTRNLSVKAQLVFVSPEFGMEPVSRCITCPEGERKDPKKYSTTDSNVMQHVLRSTHPEADYGKSLSSGRFHVTTPFDKPQPGGLFVGRNYVFTCLSSCKTILRREMTLIFTLMENGIQVGRQCFGLKICTCPFRDCGKDEDWKVTTRERGTKRTGRPSLKGRKRNDNGNDRETGGVGLERAAKLRCLSPSEGSQMPMAIPEESDNVEDIQNPAEVMKFNQEVLAIKEALKSPNPNIRQLGLMGYGILKTVTEMVNFVKNLSEVPAQEVGNLQQPPQNGMAGSPDSGIGQQVQTP